MAAPHSPGRTESTTTTARSINTSSILLGIDAEALKAELANGKGDGEILDWIHASSTTKPKPWEILVWSNYQDARGPNDVETKEYFTGSLAKFSKTREDILGWFDLLDLDDMSALAARLEPPLRP